MWNRNNITKKSEATKKQQTLHKLIRALAKIPLVLWVIFCAFSVLICRLVFWVFHNWGNLRMDELVYTMTASLDGTNPATIKSALSYTIPLTLITLLGVSCIYLLLRRKKILRRLFTGATFCVSCLVLTLSVQYFLNTVGASEYTENQSTYSTFVDENYVDPDSVAITFPEEKRNLIYIFVESMEITYSGTESGGAMETDIIPQLTQIGLENETFAGNTGVLNGGYALYGSTWTIAGMFAQTAGLPLTVSNQTITLTDGFLPGITTIGDVLEDAGYKNYLCIGTTSSFANRDLYFINHGNYEILDYDYSMENEEIPADYARDWWGYDDAILYENAKTHLTELAASGEPFNFTMLTVDTHAEDGYICSLCPDTFGDNQYANVLACASTQLGAFIEWIQAQDFYENTTIVISGDHCTMDSDFCDDVSEDYARRIYTVYINAASTPKSSEARTYSSMDNFPTTLGAMGATIEGDRLGLGTNLFSDTPTLLETYGSETMNAELAQKSELLENAIGDTSDRTAGVSYDPNSLRLTVSTDSDIDYSGAFTSVYCTVTQSQTGVSTRYTMEEADGAYTVQVPAKDFDYTAGTYKVEIYLLLPDGLPKWYCDNSLNLTETQLQLREPSLFSSGHYSKPSVVTTQAQ